MVCAQSKRNGHSLLSALGNEGSKSVLLGFVRSAIGRNERVREAIEQQFRILVGDGRDIDFWRDN